MREWERVQPEQARVPERAVADFLERLEADGLDMHGFAMLDEGKLLAEGYWAPYTASSLHRMYSVGKSFVSLAIGLLQEEGKLGLDDTICDYFRDKCPEGGVHPWIERTTIRNLLTMTTCHRQTTYKKYQGDWVESFFRVPPTNLPGAVFSYDTSATHVLAALTERLSGKKLLDYLRDKAFDRIGVSKEALFMEDPYGVSQGGSGLNCTLRDLLAVAELVTEGGRYQGEQLLPEAYLEEALGNRISTLQQTARDEKQGYGYQIWQGRRGSFYFYGIGGQLAVCFPGEQFVLVTMANTLDNKNGIKDIFDAFDDCIYPWICGRKPDEEETGTIRKRQETEEKRSLKENHSLGKKLGELSLRPVSGEAYSGIESRVSGREYFFEENMLQVSRLKVEFTAKGGVLHLTKEGTEAVLAFGRDGYVRGVFPWSRSGSGEPAECLCQGAWVMEDYLLIQCHVMGPGLAKLTIGLRFLGGTVTVKMQKGVDDALKYFEGVASGETKTTLQAAE